METIRLIEQFLDGKMEPGEKEKFLARMSSDPQFNQLVNLHKEANIAISDQDFFDFYTRIQRAEADYFGSNQDVVQEPAMVPMRSKLFRIAAALVIVISLGILIKFVFFNGFSPESLYEKYYTSYNADVISRSAQTEQMKLDNAIIDYGRHNYSDALTGLTNLLEDDPENYLAWFFKGLSELGLNKTNQAIQSFSVIPDAWDNPYIEHRNWYLALALLRKGDLTKASAAFYQIANSGGFYVQQAKEIYEKIRI